MREHSPLRMRNVDHRKTRKVVRESRDLLMQRINSRDSY